MDPVPLEAALIPLAVATTELVAVLEKKLKLMLSAWAKQDKEDISAMHPMDNANFLFMIVSPRYLWGVGRKRSLTRHQRCN
jgi:hypothetical protein